MKLTKQANYALRTLVYCAANSPHQSRVSDIAKAYGISELSLFKFIKPLVDNKLLETVRGRNGGIKLGRNPEDISILEVIQIAEEKFMLAECFGNTPTDCPLLGNCEINSVLNEALNAFMEVLGRYTIADLVKQQNLLRALLNISDAEPA